MTGEPATILVVDDDFDALTWAGLVLEGAGYRTVCVSRADDALKEMDIAAPSLVVTDLMMERLDSGFAFASAIKDNPNLAKVPILLITAAGSQRGFDFEPRGAEDLAAMRIDGLLSRPCSSEKLLAEVRRLLKAADGPSGGQEERAT
jgi:CheY-like chemotaxis protein